jgi:hypothetical protein
VTEAVDVTRMTLRRDGVCGCGTAVAAGAAAGWDRVRCQVVCPDCLGAGKSLVAVVPEPGPGGEHESVESGTAGASAQAEYDRRKAKRETRLRAAHPRIGGFLVAVTDEPQTTRAWKTGAEGERRVAQRLAELAGDDVLLLHDRRIPGSLANIDHIAVGPSGVFVIDAKHYKDRKVEVRRSSGLFRPVSEKLIVGGRDLTELVTGLAPQVVAVLDALADLERSDGLAVCVSSMLCFVDAQLPIFGSLELAGVPILGPKRASKLVRRPGSLTAAARARVHAHLAACLKPAAPSR